MYESWRGLGGSLKSERKRTVGGDQAYLYVRSVKKIAWFFKQQTEFFLTSCSAVAKSFVVLSLVQYKWQQQDSNPQPLSSVWSNGWVFIYKRSGCEFESRYCHANFRYCACFKQEVPWHSGNYRVWIHSETRTWHDNNMQSSPVYKGIVITKLKTFFF